MMKKGKVKSLKILPYLIRKVKILTPYIVLIMETRIYGNFLDDCGIGTPPKAEGEEDGDSEEEYVATMDVAKTAPSTPKLTITYKPNNKIVKISNVQYIQNDYGSTVLEVDQPNSNGSVVDLVKEAYWKDDDFVEGLLLNFFNSLLYFKIRHNITIFKFLLR